MSEQKKSSQTLKRLFAGVTENTFHAQLGVADPPLVDYLSELLVRFLRYDAIYRVRAINGRRLDAIVEMLKEAEQRVGEARRDVHRHIGDFTLFWAGLFPEALRKKRSPIDDAFQDYCSHGKRAYMIASSTETEDEEPPSDVLERLSHQFEMCAYGLREVRREWERRDGDDEIRPFLIN